MNPVILRVVVVEHEGGEILREYRLAGVKMGRYLFLKALCPYEQFFKVKVAHTHMDEDNLFIGSENTLNRVITVLSDDGMQNKKMKKITLNGTDRREAKIKKQIDAVHQFYSTVIPYTA